MSFPSDALTWRRLNLATPTLGGASPWRRLPLATPTPGDALSGQPVDFLLLGPLESVGFNSAKVQEGG